MLSKNNRSEQLRRQQPKKQRFALEKLTIGVASVLIGFTFMGLNASVNADTVTPPTAATNTALNQSSNTAAGQGSQAALKSGDAEQQSSSSANDTQANSGQNTTQTQATTQQGSQANSNQATTTSPLISLAETTNETREVGDWQDFVSAMNDANVGTIQLTKDITVTNSANGLRQPNPLVNSSKLELTGKNISRTLTIDGQGQYGFDFGHYYLSFTDNNEEADSPWNITFKDLKINAAGRDSSYNVYGGAFSPFYMGDDLSDSYANASSVTFDGVTADIQNGGFWVTGMDNNAITTAIGRGTVTFQGTNNITCDNINVRGSQLYNYSSAITAAKVTFDSGTNTTINGGTAKTNNDTNMGGNIIRTSNNTGSEVTSVVVENGATVNLNGQSNDVRGIFAGNGINSDVEVDGTLNANMSTGHSTVIFANNLNVGSTGVINIQTQQNNNKKDVTVNAEANYDGTHYGVIALGAGYTANVTANSAGTALTDNGSITIVRNITDSDKTTLAPLITFGNGGVNQNGKYTLTVGDGATLDLQDNSTTSVTGTYTNTPYTGIITMWGSSSVDAINITTPKYLNLQRTGTMTGDMIHLEGTTNSVKVNGSSPIAQWDEANTSATPSYYWTVNNLSTMNNWGTNANSGFTASGTTSPANTVGQEKVLHSNGSVEMAKNQAGQGSSSFTNGTTATTTTGVTYQTPYLNTFLNNFSYWKPQRLAMGSALEANGVTVKDNDKYQPEVKTINGTTNQTLSDLTAKDGIKDLIQEDGTTEALPSDATVTWYNSATDKTKWDNQMESIPEPSNPTGNLKTTDTSAWAKVTYGDGTVDFVQIPLNITTTTDANNYAPAYKDVSVAQGQSKTSEAPTFTESGQTGNVTAPTGTTYAKETDAPDWATVDPTTGKVTVAPGNSVAAGDYSVPVVVTYPDKSTDNATLKVTVTTPEANEYTPSYGDVSAPKGQTTTDPVSVKDSSNKDTNVPTGTTFKTAPTVPSWVTVDPSTGTITLKPTDSTEGGSYNIPVTVTYPDGTTDQTTAVVNVPGDGTDSIYYGETSTAEFSGDNVTVHKTTDDNLLAAQDHQFNKIVAKSDYDNATGTYGKTVTYNLVNGKFVNAADPTDSFNASDITYTWQAANNGLKTPNTNWKDIYSSAVKATTGTTKADSEAEKTQNGETWPGNSQYRYNFTLNDEVAAKLNMPQGYSSWVNAYYNFLGATASGTTIDVTKTDTDTDPFGSLSSEQLGTLVNHSDLDGTNYNSNIKNYSWATKPTIQANGTPTNGVVSINFNDGTHLDIPVPASQFNYKDDSTKTSNFKQSINFVDSQDKIISTANDVLSGTYTNKTPGTVSADVIKSAIDKALANDAKLKGWVVDGAYPAAETNITTATPTALTVKVKHGTTVVNPDNTDATKDADLFNTVTRTIKYDVTSTDHAAIDPVTQSVNFKRSKVLDNVTGKVDTSFTGDINGVHFTNGYSAWTPTSGTWAAINQVEQITGFDSYVDGKKATSIASQTVNGNTSNTTVTVSYVKQNSTPIKYDPNNKDMNMSVTRTIKYDVSGTGHEAIPDQTQTVDYVREGADGNAGYEDPVTQKITYVPWTVKNNGKAEFPEQAVTPIDGFDSLVDGNVGTNVPAASVTEQNGTPQNGQTVTVTYQQKADTNTYNQVINYVNNGTTVSSKTISGKYGTSANTAISSGIPTGWELVPGQTLPSTVTFNEHNDLTPISVQIQHKTHVVNPGDVTPGDKTSDAYKGMFKTVTRTINVTNPDGTKATPSVDSAEFQRSEVLDEVSGQVDADFTGTLDGISFTNGYSAWNKESANFAAVNEPNRSYNGKNYVAWINGSQSNSVPASTVTPTSPDLTYNVVYQPEGTQPSDADQYSPSYPEVVTTPGTTKTADVQYTGAKPTGNVNYNITDGSSVPSWVSVDPKTGTVTYQVPANSTTQVVNVPITITYPDGTTDSTTSTVVVVSGKDHVTNPSSPNDVINNPGNLPGGTTINWKPGEKPNPNKKGNQPSHVIVVVPGQPAVEIPTNVNYDTPTDADKYTPQGQDVTTNKGNVPDASEGIKNRSDLPAGTKDTWSNPSQVTKDVQTPGDHSEEITVTYPDGSKDTVTTTVTVKDNTPAQSNDADKYTPQGQDITTPEGTVPDASEGIRNQSDLPAGTNYTWSNHDQVTKDVQAPGNHTEEITVTYPDGSKDTVTVTVNVQKHTPAQSNDADKYTPQGQDVTTPEGTVPDPSDGIANKSDLPDGTNYTWSNPDQVTKDVQTPGDHSEEITVTYPDGSKDTVTVTVTVQNNTPAQSNDADKYTPQGQDVTTPEGTVPDPSDGIANKSDLPDGTNYTWSNPDQVTKDVQTPGDHSEEITVTYPDGSKDTITVNVNVPAPKGQDITTPQGTVPNPSDGISNKSELPGGTDYTWQQVPDVNTPGDHTGVIEVHFPDGTTSNIEVTVHVKTDNPSNTNPGDNTQDNGGNTNPSDNNQGNNGNTTPTDHGNGNGANINPGNANQGNGEINNQNGNYQGNGNAAVPGTTANNANNSNNAQKLPQTGNNTNATSLVGLALAGISAMFGIAGDRKRKED